VNTVEGLDLDLFSGRRLLVVGDLMLDEYLWGRVERVSPEAPVQVVEVSSQTDVLGGAGNVVRNLRSLGAEVFPAGVVGDDKAGARIIELLEAEGIDRSGVLTAGGRQTSRKTRVMAGHQQVVRIDRESRQAIGPPEAARILEFARAGQDKFEGLILSDYSKGTLTPTLVRSLIQLFTEAGRPVVIDPKGGDYSPYQGATLLTPNRREALEVLGIDCSRPVEAARRAEAVMAEYDWPVLMVTRGREGLSLFQSGAEPIHLPAQARQVFDVSGAGDTVVSIVGLGLACGWPPASVARLANLAGGVVVGKVGTASVSVEELIRAAEGRAESKLAGLDDLVAASQRLKAAGKKIVFTNGCFDLLHVGHIHFLQRSREQGEVLIVGLDDDASVARLKGPPRPVIDEKERARIIAALDCVDLVCVFATEDLPRLLARLAPDVLTKGANYTLDLVVGRKTVEEAGGRVVLIPLEGQATTSEFLNKIQNGGRG